MSSDYISRIKTEKKVIALTFDIGWGSKTPEAVLHQLAEKKVENITFFLSAPWVKQQPEAARQIHKMGFEIGSHGSKHENYSQFTDEWIDEQVRASEAIIYSAIGVKTNLIRTPNGDFNQRVLTKLNSIGYTMVYWSIDSIDWMNPGVQVIVHRVVANSSPGDVILMHASDTAEQTAEAIPRIVDGLREKGFEFLTVSQLMNHSKQ